MQEEILIDWEQLSFVRSSNSLQKTIIWKTKFIDVVKHIESFFWKFERKIDSKCLYKNQSSFTFHFFQDLDLIILIQGKKNKQLESFFNVESDFSLSIKPHLEPVREEVEEKIGDFVFAKYTMVSGNMDGVYQEFYPNSSDLFIIKIYSNGLQESKQFVYNRNGKKAKESEFHNGKLHGLSFDFDQQENITCISNWKNGRKTRVRKYIEGQPQY
jgi:antitoxin component YwqK of YwqJK toxin-antitoxin module